MLLFLSPLTADTPSLLLVAERFHGGDRWPDGRAHLWPLQTQCPTSRFGDFKGQVHWDPSCCIAWALELPKGVGAARSSLSRAEMRLELCQTEGGLRHSLALQLQEGLASVLMMPVAKGPAPTSSVSILTCILDQHVPSSWISILSLRGGRWGKDAGHGSHPRIPVVFRL